MAKNLREKLLVKAAPRVTLKGIWNLAGFSVRFHKAFKRDFWMELALQDLIPQQHQSPLDVKDPMKVAYPANKI